jgi:hypothetical protein
MSSFIMKFYSMKSLEVNNTVYFVYAEWMTGAAKFDVCA